MIQSHLLNESTVESLRTQFLKSSPYPNLVIDNFFKSKVAEKLHEFFPNLEFMRKRWKGINENKSEDANFSEYKPVFQEVKSYFSSPEFYDWISQITGIEKVFITDDTLGCGLHQGGSGSFLDIHVDFNIHPKHNVHRRLNMLTYLEKDWKESYDGSLEMWNKEMTRCEKRILPLFNRAVLFETSEISYHGYGQITLPKNITRKSMYCYFYTKERSDAVGYHDTVFRPKPQDTVSKKIQTVVKEKIKNTGKSFLKKVGVKIYKD